MWLGSVAAEWCVVWCWCWCVNGIWLGGVARGVIGGV